MSAELTAALGAVGLALARELRVYLDARMRRRGELRTRQEDHP